MKKQLFETIRNHVWIGIFQEGDKITIELEDNELVVAELTQEELFDIWFKTIE